jgi:CRP-like cAMP-binding protein
MTMTSAESAREDLSPLSGFEMFGDFDAESLRSLEQRCRWHSYKAGTTILDSAELANHDVFFVVEGMVRIVNFSASGREIAFANIHHGEYFGELAAIGDAPRSANVVAIEDCRLASLAPSTFRALIMDHPEIALRVIERLADIVRRCDRRIMDLSTMTAVNRIYAELLRLAKPDNADHSTWVIRPMRTQSEIASHVSTTRETVARAMKQLAMAGIVERRGKTLYIRERQLLAHMAESEAVFQTLATR